MTLSTTFQHKQDTFVTIATEATVGTIATNDATRINMPVTDYSFDNPFKHSLMEAPKRSGGVGAVLSDEMVKWNKHDRMFEVSLTFMATAESLNRVCLNLFEDGTNELKILGSMPTTNKLTDGESNAQAVTITIENAHHTGTDISFISCLCNSLTISGSINDNAGVYMCTATFVTGYIPNVADKAYSGGTETTVAAQTNYFNIHDLTTSTLDGEDVLVYGFDVNITKTVNRIGFDSSANFKPIGYAMGEISVTGNITVKRDGESVAAIDNEAGMILILDDGTFKIQGDKVFVGETGISMDDDGWKDNIPLVFTYDSANTTNALIEIHTA